MAMPQMPELPQGCTKTSIEGTVKDAPLPSLGNKPYLMEKAEYAMKFPKLSMRSSKSGGSNSIELKQIVMSGLIRADEYRFAFNWAYKAEVSFDMRFSPPKPFLSSSGGVQDSGRRHSLTPFPKGFMGGKLRRPDVTIVTNKSIRWPGQAGPDHQGVEHPNNLERIVEVKFPGDVLGSEQRRDYIRIAGSSKKFSVLEVTDCRENEEREKDREYNAHTNPTQAYDSRQWPVPFERPRKAPTPVPVYGPTATSKPAYVEAWTLAQEAVESLREGGKNAIDALSQEVRQYLESASAWLTQQGKWIRQEAGKAWEWVSESTGEVLRWTDEQLREMWQQVQRYTDLTLDMLKEIDWVQVLVDIGIVVGTVVVVIAIGAGLVAAGVPAAIVSALVVLVRLAQMFWGVLAAVLGGGAVLTAASA
ncbi:MULTISPECIES: VRR-NUC domain-containing protein [unclassified Pseudomonas]|uniref:VRR-NUC domain-containing protein n=1 Tax=unclassified Pseudomonas TaxID=196821 RepID=UPI00224A9311|nr:MULTISPECIES: VRR-NUC domain-containing protein [unclassified Pseudomonas]MCX2890641.1 VRR-NUC domain-containing protein [Pseudomonas sp. DCB_BI]MDH4552597.1 VRR-NUC domain-containing protein [Pseudomonas sp. BN607]